MSPSPRVDPKSFYGLAVVTLNKSHPEISKSAGGQRRKRFRRRPEQAPCVPSAS